MYLKRSNHFRSGVGWAGPRLSASADDLRLVGVDDPSDATGSDDSPAKGPDADSRSTSGANSETRFPGDSASLSPFTFLRAPSPATAFSACLPLSSGRMEPSRSSSSASTPPRAGPSPAPARPRTKMTVREIKPDASNGEEVSADVAFMIKLKTAREATGEGDDLSTLAPSECSALTDTSGGTDTDTTLVDERNQELEGRIASLDREVEMQKKKIERLERKNSELLKKRVSFVLDPEHETDVAKLQQATHEVPSTTEDLEDKMSSELLMAGIGSDAQFKATRASIDRVIIDLKMRLSKAESLVEDLQEENDELRHEMKEMEDEMEEIQDSFCEDQVEEYHDLRKQLEQANKNGRIVQFKLRKAERAMEELQKEKDSLEAQVKTFKNPSNGTSPELEVLQRELKVARDVSLKLGEEVEMLRNQSKSPDSKTPVQRQRSASDESQLLRDLEDTMEREADLREQLRFAEQEALELRKKLERVEEENETIAVQLKKMASKGRRQNSQDRALSSEGDEGIAEDLEELSPHELKIQLELNERETTALRQKVDRVEQENETLRRQIGELQQKPHPPAAAEKLPAASVQSPNAYYEQKINVLEEEMNQVRKKLIDKERENDILKTELEMHHKKAGKPPFSRTRSLELNESGILVRKRQPASSKPQDKHENDERLANERLKKVQEDHQKEKAEWEKAKITTLGNGASPKRKIQRLEREFADQKQECEDLARKYTLLEEDYVVCKAQRMLEKEQFEGEFTVLKHEYDTVKKELQTLRETYNTREDQWLRDKLSMEDKVREAEKRWGRAEEISWKLERSRLQDTLRNMTDDVQRLEKAELSLKCEIKAIKKEADRQLDAERVANSKTVEEEKRSREEEAAAARQQLEQLQEDLVELRSAHAKLRETSRRVIRERDRAERERAELLGRHRQRLDTDREQEGRLAAIMGQIENLNGIVPLLTKGSKLHGQRAKDIDQLQTVVTDLSNAVSELNTASKGPAEVPISCPKERRQKSYRRSASAGTASVETGQGSEPSLGSSYWGYRSPYPALGPTSRLGAGLGRKAASMGLQGSSQDSVYQRDDGSVESLGPFHCQTLPRIKLQSDTSFDRVSTESTQSEIIAGAPPVKKKGALRGLLRSWGRSRSEEGANSDQQTSQSSEQASARLDSEAERPSSRDSHQAQAGPRLRQRISQLLRPMSPSTARRVEPSAEVGITSASKRDSSATTKAVTAPPSPLRNVPEVVHTPPSPTDTAADPERRGRLPVSSSGGAKTAKRSPKRETPKIVISPASRKPPLLFSSFSRARAKFES
ncbi:cingulin-like isoform X2 [Pollicipes pollicipes]|uniref:cingulin-like isoform X2 n=1 Tax=Pollicipes pollicipes TaxID=41117 RepID=UPI001884AAF2|nr:cingulin-like isoform X2 [Pollicipes pollicipes]